MKKKKLKLEDWSPDFSECVIYSYELPMGKASYPSASDPEHASPVGSF